MTHLAIALFLGCPAPTTPSTDRPETDPTVVDACPDDPDKVEPGVCGCGLADDDRDVDGFEDCIDACPDDADKQDAGTCGCGVPDVDTDDDTVLDCLDDCPDDADPEQLDGDGDGTGDACDNCPLVPNPTQLDTDQDELGDACACDLTYARCEAGLAGDYPCESVDLLSFLPLSTWGASNANDVWSWHDADQGREYALLGLDVGLAIVDVTVPTCPLDVAFVPAAADPNLWRDVETLGDFAVIGSEAPNHGLQVVDLTRVRAFYDDPKGTRLELEPDAHYTQFGRSHTVTVDPEGTFVAANGTNTCGGGLHLVDLTDPLTPVFGGCFDPTYVHDSQCVTYAGPDKDHQGEHICITSDGYDKAVSIVGVDDLSDPEPIARVRYGQIPRVGGGYAHQGWLTEDHRTFVLGDELDELNLGGATRTLVFDFTDLDKPSYVGSFEHTATGIDHQMYVHDGRLYQANYTSGMRYFSLDDVANAELTELGYFDVLPKHDGRVFEGAWAAHPGLPSGVVVISSIYEGLFVVQPTR